MSEKDAAYKADFNQGQISVHLAVLRALIATHPRPDLLQAAIESRLQQVQAFAEASAVSEAYMDGLHSEAHSIRA